jgi:hypothetical protein
MNVNSDEAAKMLDAAVRQLVAWSDCEQLGGLSGTLQRMNEADPEFCKKNNPKKISKFENISNSKI